MLRFWRNDWWWWIGQWPSQPIPHHEDAGIIKRAVFTTINISRLLDCGVFLLAIISISRCSSQSGVFLQPSDQHHIDSTTRICPPLALESQSKLINWEEAALPPRGPFLPDFLRFDLHTRGQYFPRFIDILLLPTYASSFTVSNRWVERGSWRSVICEHMQCWTIFLQSFQNSIQYCQL